MTSDAVASSAGTSSPTSASSESAEGGAGPATSGAVIPAGAGASLPDSVGDWTRPGGSSGPGSIYGNGNQSVIVSFLSGSSYEGVVESITANKTDAGTGVCGASSSATNLTCYLKTADGVINVSADAADTPLPDLVLFADALTTALGVQ